MAGGPILGVEGSRYAAVWGLYDEAGLHGILVSRGFCSWHALFARRVGIYQYGLLLVFLSALGSNLQRCQLALCFMGRRGVLERCFPAVPELSCVIASCRPA